MTLADFLGKGVICAFLFFIFQTEEPFDLVLEERGVRKLRNGRVEREVSSARIRYAKERGRGPYSGLMVSEHALFGVAFRALDVPLRTPDYKMIKEQSSDGRNTRGASALASSPERNSPSLFLPSPGQEYIAIA